MESHWMFQSRLGHWCLRKEAPVSNMIVHHSSLAAVVRFSIITSLSTPVRDGVRAHDRNTPLHLFRCLRCFGCFDNFLLDNFLLWLWPSAHDTGTVLQLDRRQEAKQRMKPRPMSKNLLHCIADRHHGTKQFSIIWWLSSPSSQKLVEQATLHVFTFQFAANITPSPKSKQCAGPLSFLLAEIECQSVS